MATEELPTSDQGKAAEPPVEEESGSVVSVVEMLAAASGATSPVPEAISVTRAPPPSEAAVSAEGVVEASEPEPEPAGSSDLHLIFPDEAAEPEPPRVRRITEEVAALAEADPTEAPAEEPAPVLTETMAELYARQGHVAEALNVYRALALRQPHDARLASRIRDLEAGQAAGGRRMSYVAVDTGGESVESFFRSLTDARPAGTSPPVHEGDDGGGAPTRPASDALSLSAIFGEEAASAAPAQTGEPAAPASGQDSFSFDQFFGGGGPSAMPPGQRQSMPSDEDLDQFQNWLKSLKR
jgi:hypothetical protein